MISKEKYRRFCETEENIPIFSKDWWLDAVCGIDNWDVIIIEKDDSIIASLPYSIRKESIFNLITMPLLTQTLGTYIKYPLNQKYERKLAYEKQIMGQIIEKLPYVDSFTQQFHHSVTNWLPFYWKGFQQTTRYTYIIENLHNSENIFKNFSHAKRKNIKKAEKILDVEYNLSAKDFYTNHKMTLTKQNRKIIYSFELFKTIYEYGYKHQSAITIYAIDKDKNIHGALFMIWDKNSAYNLISTIDPDFRNSGSASLLIKKAITFVASKSNTFDFEGSMIEDVENSFRQFGAIQKPYFQIYKSNSKLWRLKHILTKAVNR